MSEHSDFNQRIIDTFRANGGVVPQFGRSLVLEHHVGAKSGLQRVSPVMALREGEDTWLIAASKAGAPDNPAWFHNLQANPDAEIETPDGVVLVRAEELVGADREAAWVRFTTVAPGFKEYEAKTTRTIPVIALRRRASD